MIPSSRRTLVLALVVSLLLHAVLLSSALRLFPLRLEVAATSLKAELRERGAAGSAPGAPLPHLANEGAKPSSPRAASAPQVVASPVAAVAAEPLSAAREDSPSAPPAATGSVSGAVPPPSSASGAAPNVSPGAASATAPAVGRSGVSGDDLRQYRLSLASAARRFKRYPALATQRGWEGTVEVALNVSALAPVPEVVLVRSSGRSVLDEQALEMLSQAARVTALPDGLRARDFRIVLPVQFSLENDR